MSDVFGNNPFVSRILPAPSAFALDNEIHEVPYCSGLPADRGVKFGDSYGGIRRSTVTMDHFTENGAS